MKYRLALLTLLTVLISGVTQPGIEAFSVVELETYSGVENTNYFADSVLISTGSIIEKSTAAYDDDNSFSIAKSVGSELYVGFEEPFDGFAMDVDTSAAGGAYKVTYWNGSGWSTLIDSTSGSIKNNSSTGVFELDWSRPSNWDNRTINIDTPEDDDEDVTENLYFVKLEVKSTYDNAASIGQLGILDYNLVVRVEDETGDGVSVSQSDFDFSGSGNLNVYEYKKSSYTHYFAFHATGNSYTYELSESGYDTAEDSSTLDKDQTEVTLTLDSNQADDDDDDLDDGVELTVSDLSMDDDDLMVKVENTGDEDVDNDDNVYLYVYVDGDKEASYLVDEDYLESGETVNVNFTLDALDNLDEEVEVEACIDATDNVDEDNEDNNCRSEDFGEDDGDDEVDFEVIEVYGDEDDFYYTLANTGDEDATDTSSLKVKVTVEQDGDTDTVATTTYSNSSSNEFFEEGEESTYNLDDILEEYFDDGSDFDVTVCIDSDDDYDEESESNNCMTVDDGELDDEPTDDDSCGNFTDIDNHWAEEYICNLYDRDVVDGRSSTKFYPDYSVTRAEFLKMTLLGLDYNPSSSSGVYYSDVDSHDWHYEYVTYATAHGIVDGYSDGSFKPDQYITRAEAISMLLKAADAEDYSFDESDINYWDVDESDWFAWAVVVADEDNIMDGYSDDSFRPDNHITRGEAAKVVDLSYEEYIR